MACPVARIRALQDELTLQICQMYGLVRLDCGYDLTMLLRSLYAGVP